MPYTPSHTWAAGERLDAVETQDNLDGLKIYAQQTDSGGFVTSQFIDTQHIVKPFVDTIRNIHKGSLFRVRLCRDLRRTKMIKWPSLIRV